MNQKRHFWGAIAGLAAALYAGAADAQSTPPNPAISDGVVKIGLILDMSGPYSQLTGKGSATAAQMAVEDFGGKVLGAPIQVVIADHHNNTDQAAAIARDWYGDQHVDAIMDVAGSSEALIVQAIAGTRDKIVILNAPGANRLTEEGCSSTSVHYTNDTYSIAHSLAARSSQTAAIRGSSSPSITAMATTLKTRPPRSSRRMAARFSATPAIRSTRRISPPTCCRRSSRTRRSSGLPMVAPTPAAPSSVPPRSA